MYHAPKPAPKPPTSNHINKPTDSDPADSTEGQPEIVAADAMDIEEAA